VVCREVRRTNDEALPVLNGECQTNHVPAVVGSATTFFIGLLLTANGWSKKAERKVAYF